MAFCILVQFVAGLFVSTLHTLATRPLGFAPERLLVMDGGTPKDQPAQFWMQGADRLRATPGVRSVAFAGWALLQRDVWRLSIRVPGSDPATAQPWALEVSPGYFATMEVRLLDGREFRVDDPRPRFGPSKLPLPGVAIVNQAFAKTYFNGQNPVGRTVEIALNSQVFAPAQIVGYVADTVYRDMREPMHAVIYLPQGEKWHNTFLVRTAGDPLPMIPVMRRALAAAGLNYGVHLVQPESLLLRWQTLRERLLASLSLFFAVVAMLLAAIGLYGVLNYSIAWQRREIGIRMALGARPLQIVRRTARSFAMATSIGVAAGLGAGAACGRFLESLLFGIKAGDLRALAVPILLLIVVALAAALPPALRAVRIDPAETLRAE
jgi:predicted permease